MYGLPVEKQAQALFLNVPCWADQDKKAGCTASHECLTTCPTSPHLHAGCNPDVLLQEGLVVKNQQ
jgi:hypothetical protein